MSNGISGVRVRVGGLGLVLGRGERSILRFGKGKWSEAY